MMIFMVIGGLLAVYVQRGPSRGAALDVEATVDEIAQRFRSVRGQAIATSIGAAPSRVLTTSVYVDARATAGDLTMERCFEIRFPPDGGSSGSWISLTEDGRRVNTRVNCLTGRVSVLDAR